MENIPPIKLNEDSEGNVMNVSVPSQRPAQSIWNKQPETRTNIRE